MIELKNITKTFGEVVANSEVSMKVTPGTIHAIVGENGAGKSTIMRIVYGFYAADSGEILFNGEPVLIKNPHVAIDLGIGMVHQHFMLVENMTVVENIILGAETGSEFNLDIDEAAEKVKKLSEDLGLGIDPHAVIEDLSVGQQQRVELLKALYRDAQFLILDEPTAVLTPNEVEDFFAILRSMREQGKTIVIITHKLDEVLSISDNVTVMRDGKAVGNLKTEGTTKEKLAELIVGREVLLRVEKTEADPGDVVLKVEDLHVEGKHGMALNGVSFSVSKGEIVGIAGVEGNGQTELIESIAGLQKEASGSITYEGKDVTKMSARQIKQLGVAHIPEDRHKRGLLLESDLAENAILGVHHQPPATQAVGLLDVAGNRTRTNDLIKEFDVRPPNPDLSAKIFVRR